VTSECDKLTSDCQRDPRTCWPVAVVVDDCFIVDCYTLTVLLTSVVS